MTDSEVATFVDDCSDLLDDAYEFARSSPFPDPQDVEHYVYAG